jgi:hypothetical protein
LARYIQISGDGPKPGTVEFFLKLCFSTYPDDAVLQAIIAKA